MNASVRRTVNALLSVRKRGRDAESGNANGQDLSDGLAALLGRQGIGRPIEVR